MPRARTNLRARRRRHRPLRFVTRSAWHRLPRVLTRRARGCFARTSRRLPPPLIMDVAVARAPPSAAGRARVAVPRLVVPPHARDARRHPRRRRLARRAARARHRGAAAARAGEHRCCSFCSCAVLLSHLCCWFVLSSLPLASSLVSLLFCSLVSVLSSSLVSDVFFVLSSL